MIVRLFRELRAPFTKQRGGKVPKQRTEAKRLVRPGRNGSHAGVTQALRGAKRASGDRRRGDLFAGTRQSQSGEKRRASPIFARQKDTRGRISSGLHAYNPGSKAVADLLNEAWKQFHADPAGFSVWESEQLQRMRKTLNLV